MVKIRNIYGTSRACLRKDPSIRQRALLTVICWMFLFFMIVPVQWSMAEEGDYYEENYGKDLNAAPFAMRFHFEDESGKSWQKASYDERLEYIEQWEEQEQQEESLKEQEETSRQAELEQQKSAKEQEKASEAEKIRQREQVRQDRIRAQQEKKRLFEDNIRLQKEKIRAMKDRATQKR